jgi:hypothetical protein
LTPSLFDWTAVLGGVKDALASLGGCAVLDHACAPRVLPLSMAFE